MKHRDRSNGGELHSEAGVEPGQEKLLGVAHSVPNETSGSLRGEEPRNKLGGYYV